MELQNDCIYSVVCYNKITNTEMSSAANAQR